MKIYQHQTKASSCTRPEDLPKKWSTSNFLTARPPEISPGPPWASCMCFGKFQKGREDVKSWEGERCPEQHILMKNKTRHSCVDLFITDISELRLKYLTLIGWRQCRETVFTLNWSFIVRGTVSGTVTHQTPLSFISGDSALLSSWFQVTAYSPLAFYSLTQAELA